MIYLFDPLLYNIFSWSNDEFKNLTKKTECDMLVYIKWVFGPGTL